MGPIGLQCWLDGDQVIFEYIYVGTFKNRSSRHDHSRASYVRRREPGRSLPVHPDRLWAGGRYPEGPRRRSGSLASKRWSASASASITIRSGRSWRRTTSAWHSRPGSHGMNISPRPRSSSISAQGFCALRPTMQPIARSSTRGTGVLVGDTDAGFCAGLTWASAHLAEREPEAVADTIRDHSWAGIVENNLLPFLEGVMR